MNTTGGPRPGMKRRFERAAARLGLHTTWLAKSGAERPCLVFFPSAPPPSPAPLVVMLHGGAANPLSMARLTRFHEIAERERFFVAYASGAGPFFRLRTWNAGGKFSGGWAEKEGVDDVGFIRDMIGHLCAGLSVDRTRIYAAGLSKGAMMAYRLALEASDIFAAIAAVAGPMCQTSHDDPAPVSVLHIHGLKDANVPFKGGRGRFTRKGAEWPPAESGIEFWKRIDRCGDAQISSSEGGAVSTSLAVGDDASVELIELARRGHEWPRNPKSPFARMLRLKHADGFDASEEIWRFFRDQRLHSAGRKK
jgi:polyhydroxybutyrate depolymerase